MARAFQGLNVIFVAPFGVKMVIALEHLIKNNQVELMVQLVKAVEKEKSHILDKWDY